MCGFRGECECVAAEEEKSSHNRAPTEHDDSGFGGRRTSDRESEPSRLREGEGFVVHLDDGKQSARPTLSVGRK